MQKKLVNNYELILPQAFSMIAFAPAEKRIHSPNVNALVRDPVHRTLGVL
jgi:hypothetical protein